MAMSILGVVFYFVHQSDPANGKAGQNYATASGHAVTVTPSNFDLTVVSNPAPVLAYFWAPW